LNDEAEIKDKLRQFIARKANQKGNQKTKTITAEEITDDLALIEQRIITSLHVMELLVFIERLRGKALEIDGLKPGSFRDVATIYQTFFGCRHDQ
jgi:acyl carrier protein